jgi:hypothetical protein
MLHELHAARLQAGQPGAFPTNSALTSTAFFVDCASTNMLGERFRFDMVDAPGVPACTSLVAKAFAPSNNAWCVTLGLTNGSPPDVPFLFTRNFAVKGKTNMLHLVDRMKADEQPFGDTMGLVVTFGGRVRVLRKEQIYSKEEFPEIFNPSGYRHSFLRP